MRPLPLFALPVALLVALPLAAPAAAADAAMNAAEFDAYTTGKTLTFHSGGQPYGTEQYLPGRRVVWAFLGDECRRGSWYEAGGQICFLYDDQPDDPQCWAFFDNGPGLLARFQDDPMGTELVEVDQSPDPLFCPGPDVGV